MSNNIAYYQNGERIIQAGEFERRMYVILEGTVSIILRDKDNSINVANLRAGDFFGEISLFNDTPRSADALAMGQVKLFYIDSLSQLKGFLMKNPAFGAKMVHILARRLARTDEILIGKISEINRLKMTQDV